MVRGLDSNKPLHLYRHLLRESTYLPPVCRPYIFGRIKAQFQRHRYDKDARRPIRTAQHDLRFLRAANAGDMGRMRRVLLMTFGRVGKRRRELVEQLVRPEPPADTAALEQMIKQTSAGGAAPAGDWLDKWDTEKLTAFAISQASTEVLNSPHPKLRPNKAHPESEVPTENAWGRPLADRLARTKLLKAWKQLIHRILPPVARGEWELLRDLAMGTAPAAASRVPERRPTARASLPEHTPVQPGSEKEMERWAEWATRSVRAIEYPESRRMKALTGLDSPGSGPAMNVHRYTPRFWRRLYYDIWQLTATVEKNATSNGWDVEWGKKKGTLQPARPAHDEFFEDVPKPKRATVHKMLNASTR